MHNEISSYTTHISFLLICFRYNYENILATATLAHLEAIYLIYAIEHAYKKSGFVPKWVCSTQAFSTYEVSIIGLLGDK